jgi:ABC-type uncharacterized transport system ATPase subunit
MDKANIFTLLGSNGAGSNGCQRSLLRNNGDVNFDENENKRPMNNLLYAKRRTYP